MNVPTGYNYYMYVDLGSLASSVEVEDNEIRSPLPLSWCVPDAPSQTLQLPRDDVSELIEKLHNFVSGQNAKIFARLDSLEKRLNAKLDYLEKKLSKRPETISRIAGPPPFEPALVTPEPSQTPFSSPCFVSSPLQELNYNSNVQEYSVPDDILYTSLSACKSRTVTVVMFNFVYIIYCYCSFFSLFFIGRVFYSNIYL